MKDKRGFTILELIVSFTLTVSILVILFELVIIMKNLYEDNNVRAQLLNNQNLLIDLIYTDINNKGVSGISISKDENENIVTFTFNDYTTKTLKWGYGINESENGSQNLKNIVPTISYGDYVATYPAKTSFDTSEYMGVTGIQVNADITSDNTYNSYSIEIPVYNSLFDEQDFGLNIFLVTGRTITIGQ